MSAENWIGLATVGVGLIAAVIALIANKISRNGKLLDLRIELRRAESTLHTDIHGMTSFLEHAKKSRTNLAAAQGRFGSGATKYWISEWEADLDRINSLKEEAPVLDQGVKTLTQDELEERLVAAHKLRARVDQILDKYRDSLAIDDKERAQLHADQQAIMMARMRGEIK